MKNIDVIKPLTKLEDDLVKITSKKSNYETKRNYIPMSQAYKTEEELISDYKNGYSDNELIRLKCYKGYQMERDIIEILTDIYGEEITTDICLSAYSGLVQGHPDFKLWGMFGDVKSVLMDKWIPDPDRIPRRVYMQMQSYMLFSNTKRCLLIYESRESGLLKVISVHANDNVQLEINIKFKHVVDKVLKLKK